MDSSRTHNAPKRTDPRVGFPAPRCNNSGGRRTPSWSSFSSLSSSSSNSIVFLNDSPLNSPATPLRYQGVPFSWEKLPGIPKKLQKSVNHRCKNESTNLLPLPPHPNHLPTARKYPNSARKSNSFFARDPFVAALVECSKDDEGENDRYDPNPRRFQNDGGSSKALSKTSVSDRFGFVNLYGSCRRTCSVSESIVHLPGSTRASYSHLSRRRRSR